LSGGAAFGLPIFLAASFLGQSFPLFPLPPQRAAGTFRAIPPFFQVFLSVSKIPKFFFFFLVPSLYHRSFSFFSAPSPLCLHFFFCLLGQSYPFLDRTVTLSNYKQIGDFLVPSPLRISTPPPRPFYPPLAGDASLPRSVQSIGHGALSRSSEILFACLSG